MDQVDLSIFFQTKMGALDFTSRLSAISEQLYKSGFNLEKSLLQEFGIQKKDAFLSIIRNTKVDIESNTSLKNFITNIQEKISSLPTLSIKLAFEPDEKTLKAISEWFIINIKKQMILDISVDPNLIAGADISYNGEYMNLSIRKKFETILSEILTSPQTKTTHETPEIHPSATNHQAVNLPIGN